MSKKEEEETINWENYDPLELDWITSINFKFDHENTHHKSYDEIAKDGFSEFYILPNYIKNARSGSGSSSSSASDVTSKFKKLKKSKLFTDVVVMYMRSKSILEKIKAFYRYYDGIELTSYAFEEMTSQSTVNETMKINEKGERLLYTVDNYASTTMLIIYHTIMHLVKTNEIPEWLPEAPKIEKISELARSLENNRGSFDPEKFSESVERFSWLIDKFGI